VVGRRRGAGLRLLTCSCCFAGRASFHVAPPNRSQGRTYPVGGVRNLVLWCALRASCRLPRPARRWERPALRCRSAPGHSAPRFLLCQASNHNILRLCFRARAICGLNCTPQHRTGAGVLGALGSMVYTDETWLSQVSSLHHAGS
jgi:hypothetical protein